MKKIKVLIVSVLAGSGHNSAADFLSQHLANYPQFEVIRYTNPSKKMDSVYNQMTKYIPFFQNFIVKTSPVITADVINLANIEFAYDALKQLRLHKPDIVISTHFFITNTYRIASWVNGVYPIIMSTFLDYGRQWLAAIPYNIYMRSDYSIVYDSLAQESLKKIAKQKPEYIILSGHDCRVEFKEAKFLYKTKEQAKIALKQKFAQDFYSQLSPTKKTIIIAGGGGGTMNKSYKLLKAIARRQVENLSLLDEYQVLVICGQNRNYYKKILKTRNKKLSWQNIFPFAWLSADEYALIQRSADFPILFGIAPATLHELCETECGPLIIHKVRANHEFENVKFVEEHRLGSFIKNVEEVVDAIISNKLINQQSQFVNNAEKVLAKEAKSLEAFAQEVEKAYQDKDKKRGMIYEVGFLQKLASVFLVIITLLFYYIYTIISWSKLVIAKIISLLKSVKG